MNTTKQIEIHCIKLKEKGIKLLKEKEEEEKEAKK